jgi:hypothetical protein
VAVDAPESERHSVIASTVGGVMTDEVGAVTGDLEISTQLDAGRLNVSVRYAGADEWYRVTGSPIHQLDAAGSSPPEELHERVVEHLTKPGAVVEGNEEPTSLRDFSLA